jgi:hypothetical protein
MSGTSVIFNLFPRLARAFRPACQTISSDTARFVEAAAAGGSPVATGFLASSVYSVTPKYGSTYSTMGTPPGDSYALPEQTPGGPDDSVVGVAANYGIYVEMGHHTHSGSYVPAQPFFYPAIEQGAQAFPAEAAKLEALLLENMG